MGIALKFYSCVGSNHTTLDAVRTMQARHWFGPADVERIAVHGSQVTVDHVGWPYQPQGMTSAQLNLPYCVATMLLEGDVFVDQFTEAMIADPSRIALSRRVQVVEDPAITGRGRRFRHMVRVEVLLRDGTWMEETVEAPRGSEHSFASEADVIGKFRKLAGRRLPSPAVDRIVEQVMGAERLGAAADLVASLAAA
jgi:aconitate decarboxylase